MSPLEFRARKRVNVIAVTGGKGGVGKSTISLNLAAACAALGREVLLLDGDLGLANIDVMLGLVPRHTLADVVEGGVALEDILMPVRPGLRVVPGASGIVSMAALGGHEHLGLVRAFSALTGQYDVLIVDTAAGISPGTLQLVQAAQHVLVVVCDEPASITDAYASIKALRNEFGIRRFRIVTNMTRRDGAGERLFATLNKVSARFLDVVLEHSADLREDELLRRAIRRQRLVIEEFPDAVSSIGLRNLAARCLDWPLPHGPRGNIEFFVERSLKKPPLRLQVVR